MPQHAAQAGLDLHEHRNIDTATLDQSYLADGVGSGVWTDAVETFTMIHKGYSLELGYFAVGSFPVIPFQSTMLDIMYDTASYLNSPGAKIEIVYTEVTYADTLVATLTYEDVIAQGGVGLKFTIEDTPIPAYTQLLATTTGVDSFDSLPLHSTATYRFERRLET